MIGANPSRCWTKTAGNVLDLRKEEKLTYQGSTKASGCLFFMICPLRHQDASGHVHLDDLGIHPSPQIGTLLNVANILDLHGADPKNLDLIATLPKP